VSSSRHRQEFEEEDDVVTNIIKGLYIYPNY